MKKIITCSILIMSLSSMAIGGSLYTVKGYFKSNGTYVSPHLKTTPDAYKWNNLSYGK